MNEPRFTKGEWQHESDNVFHENGFHIARASMRQTVSECIANAALIAAAPELWFCLNRIIAELPRSRDWLDPTLEAMAKAALTKANPSK